MTLFLFVVMMLNIDTESIKTHLIRYLPFGLIIVALIVGLLMVAVPVDSFKSTVDAQQSISESGSQLIDTSTPINETNTKSAISNTEAIGLVLYTDYLLAFELAAVILLVAIVSAITLVHRGAVRSKRQNIPQQIMTRREERVKLINMKSEK
jgi:NADH-quinone oxidoreductase subunit J